MSELTLANWLELGATTLNLIGIGFMLAAIRNWRAAARLHRQTAARYADYRAAVNEADRWQTGNFRDPAWSDAKKRAAQ